MKAYRFPPTMARSGYKCLSILLLVTFLFSFPVTPAQAAEPRPERVDPQPRQAEAVEAAAPQAVAPLAPISCALLHAYQSGETLAQIAARYQVSVAELQAANPWLASQSLQADCSLCIPASKVIYWHNKAELHAYLILGHLTVYGWDFPKNTRYNVRVMANRSDVWYKIGYLRSAKNGDVLAHFKLPKDIRYPKRLKVCLKEIDTGWTICTQAEVIRF